MGCRLSIISASFKQQPLYIRHTCKQHRCGNSPAGCTAVHSAHMQAAPLWQFTCRLHRCTLGTHASSPLSQLTCNLQRCTLSTHASSTAVPAHMQAPCAPHHSETHTKSITDRGRGPLHAMMARKGTAALPLAPLPAIEIESSQLIHVGVGVDSWTEGRVDTSSWRNERLVGAMWVHKFAVHALRWACNGIGLAPGVYQV